MGHYFRSTAVDKKQEAWNLFIAQMFGPAEIFVADETSFSGEIRGTALGRLHITRVSSTYEDGRRTKAHLQKETEERFLFVFLRSGRLQISHGERDCELKPGMFTLFDCNAPYVFRHTEPTDVINIAFPSKVLRSRLTDPVQFLVRPKSGDCALGRILTGFIESVAREAEDMPEHHAAYMSNQITDIIGTFLESSGAGLPGRSSAVQSAIYRRCAAFIESNLADPDLAPSTISEAMRVSVRYLHLIFQSSGETVGDFLRRRRLERSYSDLLDPGRAHWAVKQIAYEHGFRSPSHFTNAFKSHYGVSPSEIRAGNTSGSSR